MNHLKDSKTLGFPELPGQFSQPLVLSYYFFTLIFVLHSAFILKKFNLIYLLLLALHLHCCTWRFCSYGEWWLQFVMVCGLPRGFFCCTAQILKPRLQQLWLWSLERRLNSCGSQALVAPQHVESSWTRNRTLCPCIGRWVLIHCATKEVMLTLLLSLTAVFLYCLFATLSPP